MPREKVMAAVDIGPQAVQMLVARLRADGRLEPINEYVASTHLAANLAETGMLSEDSMANTVQAAKEMQDIAMKEGAVSMVVTACSVMREATNRSKFLLLCHQKLNIYPQLLSGKDEARLNFLGVSQGLESQRPLLTLGVGPMNTQFAFGSKGSLASATSVSLGAVTLERLYSLGVSANILRQKGASGQLRRELEEPCREFHAWTESLQEQPMVIVSGSLASCLAAIIRKQPLFDFKTLNHTPCSKDEVLEQFKRLARLKTKERLAVPGITSEIEPYLVSGLFLLHGVLDCLKVDSFKTSSSGMRAGVLKYFMDIP